MSEYDTLLKEVKTKFQAFRRSTAKNNVPNMYQALRNEIPALSPEDARHRITKFASIFGRSAQF
jgi:hypothetical protein